MGELDCREGLLQAVRQAKHASPRTAVDNLADIYVQALVDMAGTKALRVLVHPIPPVQDACRLVVRHLNSALQARLADTQVAQGSVAWLDCESAMLEPKAAVLEVRRVGRRGWCTHVGDHTPRLMHWTRCLAARRAHPRYSWEVLSFGRR